MKLSDFIPIRENLSNAIKQMVTHYKTQSTDNEQQIVQNITRFQNLNNAIATKLKQGNPLLLRAIPKELQADGKWRDVLLYKNYEDLVRVLKAVEKKDTDIYKQAIEYYKKTNEYEDPRTIGMYVAQFKKKNADIKKALQDKDQHVIDLLPKGVKPNEGDNILMYRSFKSLEEFIDGAFPFTSDEKAEMNSAETDADLVYNKDGIEIYKGDAEHKCVRYGHNNYYSWCISRTQGSLYGSYRFMNSDKMFYFVFDKNVTDKKDSGRFVDPYNAVVIHVDSSGLFTRSTAANNGDSPYGGCRWSQLGQSFEGAQGQRLWNKIKGLESVFKYIPPSSSERKAHGFRGHTLTLDQFIDLDPDDKVAWLRVNAGDRRLINKDIVLSLNNEQINDLINHNRQFSFNELEENKGLLKRYADYRYTRFPTEPLPYPFIPYLKPELQDKYFNEFEYEFLNFETITKYFNTEIIDKYIEQQINKLGFLPKEAIKYMNPKQLKLFDAYSVAQSQFKIIDKTQANQKDIIGTIRAPEQEGLLNTPSAEYLQTLPSERIRDFTELIKKVKPEDKYIEFIYGVPITIDYQNNLYFYLPLNQNNNELDTESEWVISDSSGKIMIRGLLNKSEEGLTFYKRNDRYKKFVGAEDYLVGSTSIPLKAGIDFDTINLNFLNNKKQSYTVSNLSSILKEVKEEDSFVKRLQTRAGLK